MPDPSQAASLGQLPGATAESRYAEQFDAREDYQPGERDAGEPWIGEDQKGIWLRRDPEVELSQRPWLWQPVQEARAGLVELRPADYERLSSVHYQARVTLLCAIRRDELARTRPPARSEGEPDG